MKYFVGVLVIILLLIGSFVLVMRNTNTSNVVQKPVIEETKVDVEAEDNNTTNSVEDEIKKDVLGGVLTLFFQSDSENCIVDLGELAYANSEKMYNQELGGFEVNKLVEAAKEIGITEEKVYKDLNDTSKFSAEKDNGSCWYDSESNTMGGFYGDGIITIPNYHIRDLKVVKEGDSYLVSGVSYDSEFSFGAAYTEEGIVYKDGVDFYDFCISNELVKPMWSFEYRVIPNEDYKYSKYKYLSVITNDLPQDGSKNLQECILEYNFMSLDLKNKSLDERAKDLYKFKNEFTNTYGEINYIDGDRRVSGAILSKSKDFYVLELSFTSPILLHKLFIDRDMEEATKQGVSEYDYLDNKFYLYANLDSFKKAIGYNDKDFQLLDEAINDNVSGRIFVNSEKSGVSFFEPTPKEKESYIAAQISLPNHIVFNKIDDEKVYIALLANDIIKMGFSDTEYTVEEYYKNAMEHKSIEIEGNELYEFDNSNFGGLSNNTDKIIIEDGSIYFPGHDILDNL